MKISKRFILLNFLSILFAFPLFSQDKENRLALDLSVAINQYNGQFGNEMFKVGQGSIGGRAGFIAYLNSAFDLSMNFSAGELDFVPFFREEMLDGQIALQWKVNNGVLLPEDSKLGIYALAGFGVTKMSNVTDPFIPMGGGIRYKIGPKVDLHYSGVYKYSYNNDPAQFDYLQHTFGLILIPGQLQDLDQPKKTIKKTVKTPTPKVIDTDKDGIADPVDECPTEAGPASNKGCPIPDKDGDGVEDDLDLCPDEAGTADNNGCPTSDADEDGIDDDLDLCPNVFGLAAYNGCPKPTDADGDGVPDEEDLCPNESGSITNNGCPEVTAEDYQVPIGSEATELLAEAVKQIKFETGSADLERSSIPILGEVAGLMRDNPSYKMVIEGHTDNVGDAIANLKLSKARAESIKNILMLRGISSTRLLANGYGEERPISDNNSESGRSENRRVVLKLQ